MNNYVDLSQVGTKEYKRPSLLHIPAGGVQHIDKNGKVLWQNEKQIDNILHDDGEKYIIARIFCTGHATYTTTFSSLYLGLDARTALAEDDVLTTLSGEPSGNGYARVACSTAGDGTAKTGADNKDFYLNASSGAYGAESKTVTFTCATEAWSAVTHIFLTSASSGTSGLLICSLDLSASRTLQVGDSLQTSMNIYLGEAA